MSDNPTLQNWQGRQYESFGNLRIDTGNPELGNDGATTYALYAENDQGLTSSFIMSKGGQYNILNDDCITITGGVEKNGGKCINIVGANGDVTITAMENGDIRIKGKNVIIDADDNINIHSKKNVTIKGDSSIFFDTPNLATNALTGNLAPRDVSFGGLVFRGTKVGGPAIADAFTGGALESLAEKAKAEIPSIKDKMKDIAGSIDTDALQSGLQEATGGLQDALSNFGGFA
tara:strand:+ start:63 stop:758 length:696 start_codon:yes stop_codon:yes gene_type:complete